MRQKELLSISSRPNSPVYNINGPEVGYCDAKGANGSSTRAIAPRTNSVVRLRAGFKSTAHECLSLSCLVLRTFRWEISI